jgi:hypothetical protein
MIGSGLPSLPKLANKRRARAKRFSLELNSWSTKSSSIRMLRATEQVFLQGIAGVLELFHLSTVRHSRLLLRRASGLGKLICARTKRTEQNSSLQSTAFIKLALRRMAGARPARACCRSVIDGEGL